VDKGRYVLKMFEAHREKPVDLPDGELVFTRPVPSSWQGGYDMLLYILIREGDDEGTGVTESS
jgi:hypothetical protein